MAARKKYELKKRGAAGLDTTHFTSKRKEPGKKKNIFGRWAGR